MPNDEKLLEAMPVGTLGLIPTDSCIEFGKSRSCNSWKDKYG